jgi:thiol-disulfide isomerase/thioredoxin
VVLVEPFGTWCGYCRDSLKLAQQVAQESGGAVVVIGVATEYSDQASDDKLRAYLKELGVSFAVVREPDAADRLELDSMPATLVVDRQGVVRARFLGAADSGKLRAWVRALLGEDAS